MSDKVKAIIAHVTIIGFIVSLVMYFMGEKTPLTRFYLRQVLGIFLINLVLGLIVNPMFSLILALVTLGLLIFSVMGAAKEEERLIPYIGPYFQQWFTFI